MAAVTGLVLWLVVHTFPVTSNKRNEMRLASESPTQSRTTSIAVAKSAGRIQIFTTYQKARYHPADRKP